MRLQRHLHENIGAAIGYWRKRLRFYMAKADRFVQVNSVFEPCIAAEKQRTGAEPSGLRNRVLKQTAADASSAQVRRNCHLGDLIDSIPHRDQRGKCARANVGCKHHRGHDYELSKRSGATGPRQCSIESVRPTLVCRMTHELRSGGAENCRNALALKTPCVYYSVQE